MHYCWLWALRQTVLAQQNSPALLSCVSFSSVPYVCCTFLPGSCLSQNLWAGAASRRDLCYHGDPLGNLSPRYHPTVAKQHLTPIPRLERVERTFCRWLVLWFTATGSPSHTLTHACGRFPALTFNLLYVPERYAHAACPSSPSSVAICHPAWHSENNHPFCVDVRVSYCILLLPGIAFWPHMTGPTCPRRMPCAFFSKTVVQELSVYSLSP